MVTRCSLVILVSCATVALTATMVSAQDGGAGRDPTERPSVEQLIERLNSDDFQTREAATRTLREREDAVPALRKALRSEEAEVRSRAQRILEERQARASKQGLQQLLVRIQQGEVDAFVDQMVALEDYLDDKTWAAVLDLAERIVARAGNESRQKLRFPNVNTDRDTWPRCRENLDRLGALKNLGSSLAIARQVTDPEIIQRCVIVCRGQVQARDIFTNNIVFANGDVSAPAVGPLMNSIVVCDGSIEADHAFSSSVLIATGTVKLKHGRSTDCVIIDHAREALGLVKYYDTRRAGVVVTASDGAVVVKQVLESKPFRAAGVREGDRILSIDGTKVRTSDEFRRLVRRLAVTHEETTLTIERPDTGTVQLTVALTD